MTLTVLLLDLGDTLVREGAVLEGVPGALHALAARGLELALVSDTETPEAPTAEAIAHGFDDYVALVRGFGLLEWFSPPERRITLSAQAGVRKPDKRIFELALRRLGVTDLFTDAMFITENAQHVAAARALGLVAWQFGTDLLPSWPVAPDVIGSAVESSRSARFRASLEESGALTHEEPLGPEQTHLVEQTPSGPRVVRKRFRID